MLEKFSKSMIVCSFFFLICVLTCDCVAQSKQLPRVGTIKDYPATGLMTGCANLYFYAASETKPSDTTHIFLARGDGSNAWMNLSGRDVRLQQVKSLSREGRTQQRYSYRLGNVRIDVFIDSSTPVEEGDAMLKMKITLRRGRAVRTVRAVGHSDC